MGNFVSKDSKKKIGLYGGTFDPIHFGHLNLAIELKEKNNLDEVWFIPAALNPHKINVQTTSLEHRKAMIELSLQDISNFKVKNLEAERSPSYTIDTLRFLLTNPERIASHQFFLLLGEDAIPGFFHWHQPEEIVKLVPLLIGSRSQESLKVDGKENPLIMDAIRKGIVSTRVMDISATELRQRLKKRLYCGHLIPSEALKYIHEKKLYLNDSF